MRTTGAPVRATDDGALGTAPLCEPVAPVISLLEQCSDRLRWQVLVQIDRRRRNTPILGADRSRGSKREESMDGRFRTAGFQHAAPFPERSNPGLDGKFAC